MIKANTVFDISKAQTTYRAIDGFAFPLESIVRSAKRLDKKHHQERSKVISRTI